MQVISGQFVAAATASDHRKGAACDPRNNVGRRILQALSVDMLKGKARRELATVHKLAV